METEKARHLHLLMDLTRYLAKLKDFRMQRARGMRLEKGKQKETN